MLYKTKAIVLHTMPYSESSSIIHTYTALWGNHSYIIKGVRSSKTKHKLSLLSPLSILEIVAYESKTGSLHNVKDIRCDYVYTYLASHIHKTTIALFLSEILYKALKEQIQDPILYDFLETTCKYLDNTQHSVTNFPLTFLIELARYLGFAPQNNYLANNAIFNLHEGYFQSHYPDHPNYIDNPFSDYFSQLLNADIFDNQLILNRSVRQELLAKLIRYYQIHIPAFHEVKSHHILQEILQ